MEFLKRFKLKKDTLDTLWDIAGIWVVCGMALVGCVVLNLLGV